MGRVVDSSRSDARRIETIAESVGYRDQFHFSKEFKKNVGYSPSEYRRVVAQEPDKGYLSPIDMVREQYPTPGSDAPRRYLGNPD